MRKIVVFLVCLVAFINLSPSVLASDLPRLIDNAGLLSDDEAETLSDKLLEISEELECDVIVLTEQSIDRSAQAYADDFFDYNGYGQGDDRDGIILLVAMRESEWHVSGSGICNSGFNDDAFDYICEFIVTDLQSEDYAGCFNTFSDRCEEVITTVKSGDEFVMPFDFWIWLIISLVIGFIIALIVTAVMKGQLNNVRMKAAAGDYLKRDSLILTDTREIFLYRRVNRIKRVNSEGTGSHRSSSGRSHSGRGGRF